jgi:GcrA cell cycle regulator
MRKLDQFVWTDERVVSLKRMHAEGLSASKIAKTLGHGCTRNAVMGKVHRLRLNRENKERSGRRVSATVSRR